MNYAPQIAVIRQKYTNLGGAERFLYRALDTLAAEGVQLTVVTRRWPDQANIKILYCNPYYMGRMWRDLSFAHCVCSQTATGKFNIVQSHERIPCCDIYRAGDGVHREWLKQRTRAMGLFGRLGITINPYHNFLLHMEKRLFTSHRLKAVICNSYMVRDEILHYFPIAPAKLQVIYNGVDLKTYNPDLKRFRNEIRTRFNIPETGTLFLFVGSGFERKGVAALLDAMAHLPESTYALIIGHDKYQTKFINQATTLKLDHRVQFLGGQEDVKPYYGAADALVLPTLYDPFPNVIIEAMASGLPVVTSTKSGAAELIISGVHGFVCDALDISSLQAALSALLDPELRVAMGKAARTLSESFDIATMSTKLINLYHRLL